MHPLDGICAKIQRADEHIRNLNADINSLIGGDTYRLVSEPDTDPRECILSVVGPEPPRRLSAIAGEVIHQLRSSLDHLVWQLVIANKKTPNRSHQFPICHTPEKFKEACDRGRIEGIAASARSLIEARQPYKNSKDIKRHFLYVLREMDDTDKHRLLNLVVARAIPRELSIGGKEPGTGKNGDPIELVGISPPKGPQGPTEQGTEVLRLRFGKPEPDVKVTGKPIVQIVFGDLGPITEQPVIDIVLQLRNKVVGLINSFSGEFPP
jgi:hypothetical protein